MPVWNWKSIIEYLFYNFTEITAITHDRETGEVTLYGNHSFVLSDFVPFTHFVDPNKTGITLYQRYGRWGDYISITVIHEDDLNDIE